MAGLNSECICFLAWLSLHICQRKEDSYPSSCAQALAEREPKVRAGALATIVFLRVVKGKHEVSAFIDYKARHVPVP